ncbi:uncharacterized protein Fot_08812 [Forsythia ovata]|uniref:Uncharacterized protein n=1 Tax=Forsythia ovata TaxID=205694 RepID=A0ABD1WZQ7_9LAMI
MKIKHSSHFPILFARFPPQLTGEHRDKPVLFLAKVTLVHSNTFHYSESETVREPERDMNKSTSKIVMGATIVMIVIVALVLAVVLILLAQLYCSLFLRRRNKSRFSPTNSIPATPQQINGLSAAPSSLSSFYSQGVLPAPRNFLFPAISTDLEKQNSQVDSSSMKQFVYISNPIYDTPPFLTPNTSPSQLEETIETPPLTPMKKLPDEGCSVSLRDARSLCTTASDSNSNNYCISTSSLGSPSTSPSPSW